MEISPPYDAKEIANLLLDWADAARIEVSPMKLQKLLFFCHADYLVATSQPLLAEEFEAWSYGPVNASVYREFRNFARSPITGRAHIFNPITCRRVIARVVLGQEVERQLRDTFRIYAPVHAATLSQMTHVCGGPWAAAISAFEKNLNVNRRISDDLIKSLHLSQRND